MAKSVVDAVEAVTYSSSSARGRADEMHRTRQNSLPIITTGSVPNRLRKVFTPTTDNPRR
jgi:hypothetical protein